jgi:hypothetical protein
MSRSLNAHWQSVRKTLVPSLALLSEFFPNYSSIAPDHLVLCTIELSILVANGATTEGSGGKWRKARTMAQDSRGIRRQKKAQIDSQKRRKS